MLYDTQDIDLLCKKLEMYGFTDLTVKWFNSFLTNRSQRVKIGETLSDLQWLTSGVPQGGILSPIIFTLFMADLELWCKYHSYVTIAYFLFSHQLEGGLKFAIQISPLLN